jgi:hypothetical protein
MSRQTAIRVHVQVGPDHTVRLPDDVPEGPAGLIVLVKEGDRTGPPSDSLLGLLSDEPEMAEEMTRHIREARARWRAMGIG